MIPQDEIGKAPFQPNPRASIGDRIAERQLRLARAHNKRRRPAPPRVHRAAVVTGRVSGAVDRSKYYPRADEGHPAWRRAALKRGDV